MLGARHSIQCNPWYAIVIIYLSMIEMEEKGASCMTKGLLA